MSVLEERSNGHAATARECSAPSAPSGDGCGVTVAAGESPDQQTPRIFEVEWDGFSNSLRHQLDLLWRSGGLLSDLVIFGENGSLRTHKLVLSLFSPHFLRICTDLTCNGNAALSVISLPGVDIADLRLLLEFMYCGRVLVEESSVNRIVELGRTFQVRGFGANRPKPFGTFTSSSQTSSVHSKGESRRNLVNAPSSSDAHTHQRQQAQCGDLNRFVSDGGLRSPVFVDSDDADEGSGLAMGGCDGVNGADALGYGCDASRHQSHSRVYIRPDEISLDDVPPNRVTRASLATTSTVHAGRGRAANAPTSSASSKRSAHVRGKMTLNSSNVNSESLLSSTSSSSQSSASVVPVAVGASASRDGVVSRQENQPDKGLPNHAASDDQRKPTHQQQQLTNHRESILQQVQPIGQQQTRPVSEIRSPHQISENSVSPKQQRLSSPTSVPALEGLGHVGNCSNTSTIKSPQQPSQTQTSQSQDREQLLISSFINAPLSPRRKSANERPSLISADLSARGENAKLNTQMSHASANSSVISKSFSDTSKTNQEHITAITCELSSVVESANDGKNMCKFCEFVGSTATSLASHLIENHQTAISTITPRSALRSLSEQVPFSRTSNLICSASGDKLSNRNNSNSESKEVPPTGQSVSSASPTTNDPSCSAQLSATSSSLLASSALTCMICGFVAGNAGALGTHRNKHKQEVGVSSKPSVPLGLHPSTSVSTVSMTSATESRPLTSRANQNVNPTRTFHFQSLVSTWPEHFKIVYNCPHCANVSYNTANTMTRHLRRRHQDETLQLRARIMCAHCGLEITSVSHSNTPFVSTSTYFAHLKQAHGISIGSVFLQQSEHQEAHNMQRGVFTSDLPVKSEPFDAIAHTEPAAVVANQVKDLAGSCSVGTGSSSCLFIPSVLDSDAPGQQQRQAILSRIASSSSKAQRLSSFQSGLLEGVTVENIPLCVANSAMAIHQVPHANNDRIALAGSQSPLVRSPDGTLRLINNSSSTSSVIDQVSAVCGSEVVGAILPSAAGESYHFALQQKTVCDSPQLACYEGSTNRGLLSLSTATHVSDDASTQHSRRSSNSTAETAIVPMTDVSEFDRQHQSEVPIRSFVVKHESIGTPEGSTDTNLVCDKEGSIENGLCFKCAHCSYLTSTKHALQQHVIACHSKIDSLRENLFFCPHCKFSTNYRPALKSHLVMTHQDTTTKVKECLQKGQVASSTEFKRHERRFQKQERKTRSSQDKVQGDLTRSGTSAENQESQAVSPKVEQHQSLGVLLASTPSVTPEDCFIDNSSKLASGQPSVGRKRKIHLAGGQSHASSVEDAVSSATATVSTASANNSSDRKIDTTSRMASTADSATTGSMSDSTVSPSISPSTRGGTKRTRKSSPATPSNVTPPRPSPAPTPLASTTGRAGKRVSCGPKGGGHAQAAAGRSPPTSTLSSTASVAGRRRGSTPATDGSVTPAPLAVVRRRGRPLSSAAGRGFVAAKTRATTPGAGRGRPRLSVTTRAAFQRVNVAARLKWAALAKQRRCRSATPSSPVLTHGSAEAASATAGSTDRVTSSGGVGASHRARLRGRHPGGGYRVGPASIRRSGRGGSRAISGRLRRNNVSSMRAVTRYRQSGASRDEHRNNGGDAHAAASRSETPSTTTGIAATNFATSPNATVLTKKAANAALAGLTSSVSSNSMRGGASAGGASHASKGGNTSRSLKCPDCTYVAKSSAMFEKHVSLHNSCDETKLALCELCGVVKLRVSMAYHMRNHEARDSAASTSSGLSVSPMATSTGSTSASNAMLPSGNMGRGGHFSKAE